MRHVSFLNNTCHVLSKCQQRFFSGAICDDAKSKLKELYRKIHPDLFHSDPKAKVGCTVNVIFFFLQTVCIRSDGGMIIVLCV